MCRNLAVSQPVSYTNAELESICTCPRQLAEAVKGGLGSVMDCCASEEEEVPIEEHSLMVLNSSFTGNSLISTLQFSVLGEGRG